MMAGDIIVTEPAHYSKFSLKDWIARGSRAVQNTRWGHTGMYDGDGMILEARVDVLIGHGKKYDGITSKRLDECILEQNFLIVRPKVPEIVRYCAVDSMRTLLEKKYIKYDKLRFIASGLDLMGIKSMKARDFEECCRVICSEAIAGAYSEWLDFIDGRHYSQILPTHILNSDNVEHIAIVDRDTDGNIRISILNEGPGNAGIYEMQGL
jgi:hypothetical protein